MKDQNQLLLDEIGRLNRIIAFKDKTLDDRTLAFQALSRTLLIFKDAITKMVTQKADNLCWRDVYLELGRLVGLETTPEQLAMLPVSQMLKNCERFCYSLKTDLEYETDFATKQIDKLETFLKSLLNPEENGLAVQACVRDEARELLGRGRAE